MRTEDLDGLVENVANVVGWEWDTEDEVARIYVTEKVPVDELAPEDVLDDVLESLDVDVVPVGGEFRPEVVDDRFHPHGDVVIKTAPRERHRPVEDGVSEINAESTAATAGYFEAEVVDTTAGKWSEAVGEGDVVRLSNNHVYARSNEADFGEPIIQPSPYDGGSLPNDRTGELVGYVPIEDGVAVDIAARSASTGDSARKHDLGDAYGTGVRRGSYASLRGREVTKTGRTTGVTTGRVVGTSATVNVRYPQGQVRIRDCIITTGMSQGGDSGSDVFDTESGDYVGALFAGSQSSTIVCKAARIESALGVRLLPRIEDDDPPEDPPDEDPNPGFWAWLRRIIRRIFG